MRDYILLMHDDVPGPAPGRSLTSSVSGYIRVNAIDLDAARALVTGNPVYEAGGTVEIRELPKDE